MTIIRRKRNSHYATLPNAIWEDDRIGADEKGVLGYLLSRPPTWNVNLWNVGKTMKIGKDRIQRIFRALIAAGYISRRVIRNENGIISSLEYVVRDEPETSHVIPHSVVVETPSDAFVSAPQMENPAPAEQAPGRAAGYKEKKILSTDHTKYSSLAERSAAARARPSANATPVRPEMLQAEVALLLGEGDAALGWLMLSRLSESELDQITAQRRSGRLSEEGLARIRFKLLLERAA